jgi:hypothetical protein
MSALTVFLGKLIGVYCLIVALTMIANRRTTVDAVNDLITDPPLVLLSGVIAVAVGLGVVIGHNIWSGGALPVVVTLVGWASLIKGIALMALPQGLNGEALQGVAIREILSRLRGRNAGPRSLYDDCSL